MSIDTFVERLEERKGLVRRLSFVRRRASAVRTWTVSDVERVMDLFEASWAKRRVLQSILAHDVPDRTDEMQALIESLDRSSAQLWAYVAMFENGELSHDKQRAIVENVASPFVRRQLSRRLASRRQ